MASKTHKYTISPGTSMQAILEFQIAEMQKNTNAEKPGKYISRVVKALKMPTREAEYIPAFDPFWSTTDDKVRFDNYGAISDTVKSRETAIVTCPPVFDNILATGKKNFDNSFLLRVPYTPDANLGKSLAPGQQIEVTFGNRSDLTNPKMVKKTAPKASPIPAPKKKTGAKTAKDTKDFCGDAKSPGNPKMGSGGKCVCTGNYKWDDKAKKCCK
tara:strand:- start:220 stop:861 length:642 start_codon:yes stop_codon:yes gene_type:complete